MNNLRSRGLLRSGTSTLILAMLLTACFDGITSRKWTEDVLLDDGSILLVKRTVSFKESAAWGGEAYNSWETDATISFTGGLATLPIWHVPLMALVMYLDSTTREWVVVATTTSCDVWNARGFPPSMYWEYRLGPQGWRETPLSAKSMGRPANLLHRYQKSLGTSHFTVAERVKRETDSSMSKKYRRIDPTGSVCSLTVENKRKAGL